jgi:hypothetical protein
MEHSSLRAAIYFATESSSTDRRTWHGYGSQIMTTRMAFVNPGGRWWLRWPPCRQSRSSDLVLNNASLPYFGSSRSTAEQRPALR